MVRLFLGLGLLAILGLLTGAEAQACPGRFKGFNGRCYGYFGGGKPASYREAARFCTGLGAEIFMMRDATEVARLKQLLSKQNLKSFWVGLTGDTTPGSWTWSDGAALAAGDFTAWDGDKLCAFARKQNGYRWGVTGCGEKRAFICVKDP